MEAIRIININNMTTVLLKRLPRERMTKEIMRNKFHKASRAITSSRYVAGPGSSREWRIEIDKSLPKKSYRDLLHHEEGHVFSERRHLNRKLSPEQKRMLVKDYGGNLARGKSAHAKLQEVIAETYRMRKYHPKSPAGRAFKARNPRTTAIIANEIKKFRLKYKR